MLKNQCHSVFRTITSNPKPSLEVGNDMFDKIKGYLVSYSAPDDHSDDDQDDNDDWELVTYNP